MTAEQLVLDVEALDQPCPEKTPKRRRAVGQDVAAERQLELTMVPYAARLEPAAPAHIQPPTVPDKSPVSDEIATPQREHFGTWLLSQATRRGLLGDLAKAVKVDRQFPKAGSADDVRARFDLLGADGDVYEALEVAEREYDRMAL